MFEYLLYPYIISNTVIQTLVLPRVCMNMTVKQIFEIPKSM